MKHTVSLSKTLQRAELTAINAQVFGSNTADSLWRYPTDKKFELQIRMELKKLCFVRREKFQ